MYARRHYIQPQVKQELLETWQRRIEDDAILAVRGMLYKELFRRATADVYIRFIWDPALALKDRVDAVSSIHGAFEKVEEEIKRRLEEALYRIMLFRGVAEVRIDFDWMKRTIGNNVYVVRS